MTLLIYSSLLLAVIVLGLPYWLARMLISGRYRAGLQQRLGWLPRAAHEITGAAHRERRDVVWLHAVSVGEVLAATRLIADLQSAWPGLEVAISTTTETGQRLARERFPTAAVFFFPLDFGFLMRHHLALLEPRLVILMESELWPNLIHQCRRRGTPLAVVNARVSDRSFPRYLRLRRLWQPLLREVSVFLAQSGESAERLLAMGVAPDRIKVTGNLKYDVQASRKSRLTELIQETAAGRPIFVAGSTVDGEPLDEDSIVIQAWEVFGHGRDGVLLVIAPRHSQRFDLVYSVAIEFPTVRASELIHGERARNGFSAPYGEQVEIVVLDTIGDLAAVYGVANVAFVGGSLVKRGGHSPLEPAQFGVPVVMGPSYENFREVVERMRQAQGIRIVADKQELSTVLLQLLRDPDQAKQLGARGQRVFEQQQGATARTVTHLLDLLH